MNGNDAHLVLFSLQNTFKEIVIFFLTNSGSSEETEKAMAPHSGTLAWRIPWTEEPGGP